MPWMPELFSASVLERISARAGDARAAAPVPYFAGVESGETDALVRSFAGEPELHHPIRGRVKGRRAFERFIAETSAWLTGINAVGSQVERIITPRRTIEDVVRWGRTDLPPEAGLAVYVRGASGRLASARIYDDTDPPLRPQR